LAPLNDGGPTQLLNLQIQKLEQENQGLRQRLKTLESQATEILESKLELKAEVENLKTQKTTEVANEIKTTETAKEFEKLSEAVDAAKKELLNEKEISEKSQKELENDLVATKHRFLEVQHQMNMAEKELEKKFSETGAYKNLKKMLSSKNATIKELRQKLNVYEPSTINDDEREEE